MQVRKPKTRMLEAAYESAKDLFAVGALTREAFLELEEECLGPVEPPSASRIATLRRREKLSQERFAYALGVNVSSVRNWEKGLQKPSGSEARMLDLINRKGMAALD